MFVPVYNILIGSVRFSRIVETEIFKSTKVAGQTATIKLPTSAVLIQQGANAGTVEVAKQFKVGDTVTISCGYQDVLVQQEFTGYVSRIRHEDPVVIECEDEMYRLRQRHVNQSWQDIAIKQVLNTVLSEFNDLKLDKNIPGVTFDQLQIKANGKEVIEKLSSEYGLDIYFENKTLYAELPYLRNKGFVTFNISGEESNCASVDSLEYHKAEDVKLKVKAISILQNNTRIEAETGDADGDLRTLFFYNITSKADLTARAKTEIEKYKYDGYEGSFKSFFIPDSQPGMVAKINDPQYGREGNYYIEAVKITGGQGGLMRENTIKLKL